VSQLVHQQDGGTPCERRVEIEFLAQHAAVAQRECRQARQALEQPLGLDASVRFDVATTRSVPEECMPRAASSMA